LCEHGNELSGSIESRIFFDKLSDNQLFKYCPAPWSKYHLTSMDYPPTSCSFVYEDVNAHSPLCIKTENTFYVDILMATSRNIPRRKWCGQKLFYLAVIATLLPSKYITCVGANFFTNGTTKCGRYSSRCTIYELQPFNTSWRFAINNCSSPFG